MLLKISVLGTELAACSADEREKFCFENIHCVMIGQSSNRKSVKTVIKLGSAHQLITNNYSYTFSHTKIR